MIATPWPSNATLGSEMRAFSDRCRADDATLNCPVQSLPWEFVRIKALTQNIWWSTVSQSASRKAAITVGHRRRKKKKKGQNRSGRPMIARRGKSAGDIRFVLPFPAPRQGLSSITFDRLPFHPINPSKQKYTWRNRTQQAIWCDVFRGKVGRVVSVCSWRAASLPL